MASRQVNLTTLIKRLEAATSRLEDLVPTPDGTRSSSDALESQNDDMNGSYASAEQSSTATQPSQQEQLPPAIKAFNTLIDTEVKNFLDKSQQVGSLVADQSKFILDLFRAQERHLRVALRAQKPDRQSPAYSELMKDMTMGMEGVSEIRESNRTSPVFTHLSAVSDGSLVFGWVTVEHKPVQYIKETFESAQFYGNRVIQQNKEDKPSHVDWVKSLYRINEALVAYVTKYYEGGLVWKVDGIDPLQALREIKSGQSGKAAPPPPSTAGGPPPPPPLPKFDTPPAAPPMPPNGTPTSTSSSDMGAVFDQISRGSAVTSSLRKVDPSQMTHKNPSLRAASTVPTNGPSSLSRNSSSSSLTRPNTKPKPESMRTKKPHRKEFDGNNKWYIENYDDHKDLVEISVQTKHSILISRCSKTTIRINGKANAISIDNSPNVNIIVDSLVSSIDVIKCPTFAVQIMGSVPTILLDQVDGAQLYLGKESLGTEILHSKSSGVNVLLPEGGEEEGGGEDYREEAAPEQIKSVIRGGRLVSEIVEHAG